MSTQTKKDRWIFALEVTGLIGGIATVIALFLSPMLYLGAKIDTKIDALTQEMRQESKDFHGRLERQDAEFKAGMLLLEERMRG